MTSSPPVLLPSRPSLLDGLAHAALARACAAFRQSGSGESGLPPVLVDATLGNGHDAAFLLTCAPPGSGGTITRIASSRWLRRKSKPIIW